MKIVCGYLIFECESLRLKPFRTVSGLMLAGVILGFTGTAVVLGCSSLTAFLLWAWAFWLSPSSFCALSALWFAPLAPLTTTYN